MANFQQPVKPVKQAPHHPRWLLAAFGKVSVSLKALTVSERDGVDPGEIVTDCPYEQLWATLARLPLARGVWWLAGFGIRPALARLNLMGALDSGAVLLPSRMSADGEIHRQGRLVVSPACVEVDCQIGRNRYKVIDLSQLGLSLDSLGLILGAVALSAVVQVVRAYLAMCDDVGLSVSRVSAAQIGWARFKARHLPGVLSCNLDPEARALERRCHYVGRNECFRLGDMPGTTYSLDIKSCYAAICRDRDLPVHLIKEYPHGIDPEKIDQHKREHWIAECLCQSAEADYPLRWAGTPIYPVGTYHTALAWPELSHALERGRVLRITRAARYLARPALRSYAEWYIDARRRLSTGSGPGASSALKAVFNASLGYSARKGRSWERWEINPPWRWWIGITEPPDHSEGCCQARVLDGHPEWLSVGGEPYEALPMLHATICSYARIQLLEIMYAAGRENVLYVDTDGLLTNKLGYERLLTSSGLCGSTPGQLAQRFKPGACRIGGQKNYRVGNQYVCAGGVATRYSLTAEKIVLDTPTGRTDIHGVVTPYEFTCEDEGDMRAKWVNRLTGVI